MSTIFKKSAISLIVLGLTGTAFAHNANNAPMNNWDMAGAFIGGEGLYLQPSNGDLDYVTVDGALATATSPYVTNTIKPDFNWGWRVYGGVNFGDHDDFTLSWQQLHTSDTATTLPGAGITSTPRWSDDDTYSSATGSVSFHLDDAYGEFGHTIHFNNPWSMRFAGGVEYARIYSDLDITAVDIAPVTTGVLVGFDGSSKFHGVGPRSEFDVMYGLPYGLGLFANVSSALMVGPRSLSLDTVSTFEVSDEFTNRNVIVPKLALRLGVGYGYTFGQIGGEGCTTTTLTAEAGWQTETYFDAIERVNDNAGSVAGTGSSFITTKTSNYNDQGLFVGLRLNTNWV